MSEVFERLRAIDYFRNADGPLPPELAPFCVEEPSWPRLYTQITSEYEEDWQANAGNDLTVWLCRTAASRYSTWNRIVEDARPRILQIVEQVARPRFPAPQWDESISSHLQSCLMGIVIADHYSDLRRQGAPLEPYDRMLAIFEAGCFLAGWRSEGEWPRGKFVVGRLSTRGAAVQVAPLTVEQLIDEGRRLARPTWLLTATPHGLPVASWRGESDSGRHWISVNWDRLPSPFEIHGITSIVEIEDSGFVVQHTDDGDRQVATGTALFAHRIEPLPPPFALEQESERIQNWVASKDPAKRDKLAAYVDAYQSESPFYQAVDDVYAIVSGWPIEIEVGSWAGRHRADSQLLLTLKDSEPWVELVRHHDGRLSANGIIT